MAMRVLSGVTDRFATAVLVGTGAALSILMAAVLFNVTDTATDVRLEQTAAGYAREIRHELDRYEMVLDAVRLHLATRPRIGAVETFEHAGPLLQRLAGLRGMDWLDREDAQHLLASAPPAEPHADERPLSGIISHDVQAAQGGLPRWAALSGPSLRVPELPKLVERACRTGRIVTGELVEVPAGPSEPPADRRSVVLLAPVHAAMEERADIQTTLMSGASSERSACDGVRGIMVLAAWPDRIAAAAFGRIPWNVGTLGLLDMSAPPGRRLLAVHGAADVADEAVILGAERWLHSIEVGDRQWGVFVQRSMGTRLSASVAPPSAVLAIGLTFTSLMAGHLWRERRDKARYRTEASTRAAMARALRTSEERIHLALRHARVVLASLDRDLRYTWHYDPPAMRWSDDVVGRGNGDLFPPQDAAVLDRIMRRVIETGLGSRQQVRLSVLGTERAFDVVIEPLRQDNGEIVGVTCAAMDITELWRTREALADARAAAERASFAKSRFLAAASHDLRQPFQAMSLFHHILTETLSDPKQREIAGKLGEALTAGNALLATLLDISTLEIGSVQPKPAAFPIQNLIDRLGNEFGAQANSRGLSFRLAVTSATVRSDPVLLERMIRNLLVNALRYTRAGGILLGCRRRAGRLRIEVIDTGPGIATEQLERIFEEFYRGETDRRDSGVGLGLGLAIVRRMSEILDHPVVVRSRVGRGTMFAISVPFADPDEET
ncbi:PAS domain-containing sensor histidine kinase [Azospirillum sp. RWY-5-1]|uniref:histidine kinase n=1 Tax=Azospirillum oleiclasticum TaxID=2735135 RepID=A0ABX2T6L9_9PROT|nr:PAS domain-containing sensor histidine kinase [Azospirillum oleiclasticum]NYZ11637.1 PAS domain-containing sensor histidine kinase [Azospirillum oleiclasticum]NYZ18798.1 PAS domain-containing sensor histidine kinase [Azospirillum oleiclasticum]